MKLKVLLFIYYLQLINCVIGLGCAIFLAKTLGIGNNLTSFAIFRLENNTSPSGPIYGRALRIICDDFLLETDLEKI